MKESITNVFIFAAAISIFIAGCSQQIEAPSEKFQEVIDTGVLVVGSVPGEAQVYVDGELKGQTPLNLYNFPTGTYSVVVKKDGYTDFEKTVSVNVGLTEQVDAKLTIANEGPKPQEGKVCPAVCRTVYPVADNCAVNNCGSGCGGDGIATFNSEEDCRAKLPQQQTIKINLSSFAMYYDFENKLFTKIRSEKSDIFSKKYDKYLHFTSITPAKIEILNKPLKDTSRADCTYAKNAVAQLYSGQTLCVITIEGNYFAVSGTWDKLPGELESVQLS